MDKKLQQRLFDAFPVIFKEKDLPMTQTCMCWGVTCNDGWFNLLFSLCERLQWDTDKNKYPQVVALQVKEKFGTLRFYYSLADINTEDKRIDHKCAEIDGAIQLAESLSGRICETCAIFDDTVELMVRGGWYKTLCTVCAGNAGYGKIERPDPIDNLITIRVPEAAE